MKSESVHIIINPSASGGKTARRQSMIVGKISDRIGGAPVVHVTTRPLDATETARKAILNGAELVIAVGGDGTVHEVVNGFLANGEPLNPACQLGIVGSGTAQDVIRGFGLPSRLEEQIEVACGGVPHTVDVGRVNVTGPGGTPKEHYFLNECQQGMAAVVVQRFQSEYKWLGGFLGFGLTAVVTIAHHREQRMVVEIDGKRVADDLLLDVVVANGVFAGGGMKFAPGAKVDDGLFDIILIHKQSIPSRLVKFPKIYVGSHIHLSWVSHYRGRSVRMSSEEPVPVESDGEFLGHLPCSIDILPGALRIKSPSR